MQKLDIIMVNSYLLLFIRNKVSLIEIVSRRLITLFITVIEVLFNSWFIIYT